jgi:hypothetical protein
MKNKLTLKGNVGSGKGTAGDTELVADQTCKGLDIGSVDLDTLDGGDGSCSGKNGIVSE